MADEPNPQNLDSIQKAINDSAAKASLLWTSFITLAAYLLIATGSVKHRDLFLGASIKLPVLGVELPITGFFLVAPLVLLAFHLYLVLQVSGLGKKSIDYNRILQTAVPDESDRRLMRHRLDDFPILRLMAGAAGRERFLLVLLSWATAGFFPLLVLLQMQVVFLPYHLAIVTWLQRLAVIADLFVIGLFWWVVHRSGSGKPSRRLWIPLLAGTACALVVLFFSIGMATYPGESIYRNRVARGADYVAASIFRGSSISSVLFEGDINEATGKPDSLFSNRIILPGEHFYDEDKHRSSEVSVSLRGRDLRGAVFQGSDLRKADFAGSNLIGALFMRANLKEARFRCPIKITIEREDPRADRPEEKGSGKKKVVSQECEPGLSTDLRGADFTEASVQGANFEHSRLQGTRFFRALMQGSSFADANLTASTLSYARLEGASFANAIVLGASFLAAQAQGTDFDNANLGVSALLQTQLQGANLRDADLTYASISRANLYRSFIDLQDSPDTILVQVSADNRFPRLYRQSSRTILPSALSRQPEKLDNAGYASMTARAVEGATDKTRDTIIDRMKSLDPRTPAVDGQLVRTQRIASDLEKNKSLRALRFTKLAELMCDAKDAPFVARGFINNGRVLGTGIDGGDLIAKLRDDHGCQGARGLNSDDRKKLRNIEQQIRDIRNKTPQDDDNN